MNPVLARNRAVKAVELSCVSESKAENLARNFWNFQVYLVYLDCFPREKMSLVFPAIPWRGGHVCFAVKFIFTSFPFRA